MSTEAFLETQRPSFAFVALLLVATGCAGERPSFGNSDESDGAAREDGGQGNVDGATAVEKPDASSEPDAAETNGSASTRASSEAASTESDIDVGTSPTSDEGRPDANNYTNDDSGIGTTADASAPFTAETSEYTTGTDLPSGLDAAVNSPDAARNSAPDASVDAAGTTTSQQEDSSSPATTTTTATSSAPEAPACQGNPEDPSNGGYPNCAGTPSGETCQLICDVDYWPSSEAECVDGTWTQPSCERLGSLNVRTRSRTGASVADATVYVRGAFDPDEEQCEDSPFCAVSNSSGLAALAAIPSGDQHVVLEKDGYEGLFMPVHTEVNEDADVTLAFLPEGYTSEHFTILLSWTDAIDMDLILQVPGPQSSCVTYRTGDALTEAPFAAHGGDTKSPQRYGPEVVRITPGEPERGPYYSGVYRIIAAALYEPIVDVNPEIRIVLPVAAAPDPLDRVHLYRLPSNPDPEVEAWHALNLNGDGTVSSVNDYGQMEDPSTSVLPCVAEAYQ